MTSPCKILQIGPYPPPKGGVSVHMVRLISLLERAGHQIDIIDETAVPTDGVFNLRQISVLGYLKRLMAADVVHIHSGSDSFRIVHVLLACLLRKRVVVTLHSWRDKSRWAHGFQRFLFRWVDELICVSEPIFSDIDLPKAQVRPAFIPPTMEDEVALSDNLDNWLEAQRRIGATVIASNAYQLDLYNNTDIYGTDICIQSANQLINKKKLNVSFVFAVASIRKGADLFEKYQQVIQENNLQERFLLVNESELSFVRLIERSDIILRATNTDGDALSIRETLYLQKPIIASDVVERPDGTILFTSRNANHLTEVIEQVIQQCGEVRLDSQSVADDSMNFYHQIYGIEVQSQ